MTTFDDLKQFFTQQDFKLIVAADAQPRATVEKNGKLVTKIPAGGVAIAFDPIARASGATYIARARGEADRKVLDGRGKLKIEDGNGGYTLKRLTISESDMQGYYYGFSNQTLWPLCHVTFERPELKREWLAGFERVNAAFAKAIRDEVKGKTFVWINDYQLSLVPKYLGKPKDTIVGMFWHIPWPTWEVFRILPYKREILESLLTCDFLAFHRGYHVRNFLETVEREFEARIDQETNKVYFQKHVTTVRNLPMGVDTDVITSLIETDGEESFLKKVVSNVLRLHQQKTGLARYFEKHKVILGVDRLDYTKGLLLRMEAIDQFFKKNPRYIGKAIYLGIIAPSREKIPLYKNLKKELGEKTREINAKYSRNGWSPINIIYEIFPRKEIVNFYRRAAVCLVTPRDDGMNLVSKEFVIAASFAKNPGMLVLSQFAGSAIDLTRAIIINPYDIDEVARGIKTALEMDLAEKAARIADMAEVVEEKNIYEWAREFVESTVSSVKGL